MVGPRVMHSLARNDTCFMDVLVKALVNIPKKAFYTFFTKILAPVRNDLAVKLQNFVQSEYFHEKKIHAAKVYQK